MKLSDLCRPAGAKMFLASSLADFELLVVGDACTDETEAVVRALADGGTARIGPDHELSLSGAAAALLWIDERQGRVDTVTALRRAVNTPR